MGQVVAHSGMALADDVETLGGEARDASGLPGPGIGRDERDAGDRQAAQQVERRACGGHGGDAGCGRDVGAEAIVDVEAAIATLFEPLQQSAPGPASLSSSAAFSIAGQS